MTRESLEFSVRGNDKNDLEDKILQAYRDFVGGPNDDLPNFTSVEFSPETVEEGMNGYSSIVLWNANVFISDISS